VAEAVTRRLDARLIAFAQERFRGSAGIAAFRRDRNAPEGITPGFDAPLSQPARGADAKLGPDAHGDRN
jgi:hypothetical protein